MGRGLERRGRASSRTQPPSALTLHPSPSQNPPLSVVEAVIMPVGPSFPSSQPRAFPAPRSQIPSSCRWSATEQGGGTVGIGGHLPRCEAHVRLFRLCDPGTRIMTSLCLQLPFL